MYSDQLYFFLVYKRFIPVIAVYIVSNVFVRSKVEKSLWYNRILGC